MGPIKAVHVPRLQRLMRGVNEPYLRRPIAAIPKALVQPSVTPWWYEGMGSYDLEYGASMQPRNNPAFSDVWLIGATGGANKVIPQGIDYSRTPCCTPAGMSGADTYSTLLFALIGVPLVMFGLDSLLRSMSRG